MTVNSFNGGNACGKQQSLLVPVTVKPYLIRIRVNKLLQHLLKAVPVPLPCLIKLPGVVKTLLGNGLLVVDNNVLGSYGVNKLIVLAVEVVDFHSVLNVSPQRRIQVNIIINRLEHSADYALRKRFFVTGEEVNA